MQLGGRCAEQGRESEHLSSEKKRHSAIFQKDYEFSALQILMKTIKFMARQLHSLSQWLRPCPTAALR